MSNLTVVTYCHSAHRHWIPFWIAGLNEQTLVDFDILFIAHNWEPNSDELELFQESERLIEVHTFKSEPVIGEVIDFACGLVKTEFFAHWDIDDPMHPNRLEIQENFLLLNPTIDFLNARCQGFNGAIPDWPEDLECGFEGEDMLGTLLKSPTLNSHEQIRQCFNNGWNCLSHGLMVYRPDIILKLGGFSRSDVKKDGKSPDFETWKKAMAAGYKFHRLPELLMMWRLDSSSIRS